jgi:predicted transposase YbfD/YdcC
MLSAETPARAATAAIVVGRNPSRSNRSRAASTTAAQAIQIIRRRKVKSTWSRETCYAVTSLTHTQASHAQLAAIIRGHWGIEDRLHWVRDTDFDEDRSQVRTGTGPRIMPSLRNLAITILRLSGATSIAAALRYHARRPSRPIRTITR